MKACICYAIAVIGMIALSTGAYACNSSCNEGGAGNFDNDVNVTLIGSSSSYAQAFGSYSETHVSGKTAGDGWISRPGVDVSGNFKSAYDANAGRDGWGESQAQGGSMGGLSLEATGGHGIRSFSGANLEKSEALAQGGWNDTATWNKGRLDGSAWLDQGRMHTYTDAHSRNQGEDSWTTDAHSGGEGGIAGQIQMELQHQKVPGTSGGW